MKLIKRKDTDDIVIENIEELDGLTYASEQDDDYIFQSVNVTKKDFSVFELFRKYKQEKLFLDVEFQREYVWSSQQSSELIESILMGLPLPIFYLKQSDNAKLVVVDGKQRLTALFSYLSNGFMLKNLKIMPFLNGKKFMDLVDDYGIYQSQLEDYQVYAHVILPPTPDQILFDIFDRVNRGGTKLNKQEIRNALYYGKSFKMIDRVRKLKEFERVTGIKRAKDKRMKGSYLLTRYLTFYLLYENKLYKNDELYIYNGNIDDLIELSLTYLNSCEDSYLKYLESKLEENLHKAWYFLGRKAFRKELDEKNPVNMNIFETMMYFLSKLNISGSEYQVNRVVESLSEKIKSKEYLSYIEKSRDDVKNVKGRFSLLIDLAEKMEEYQ